ncbi:hypothetical protein GCM10009718_16620 [Isoptericola halotolerans]
MQGDGASMTKYESHDEILAVSMTSIHPNGQGAKVCARAFECVLRFALDGGVIDLIPRIEM